MDYRSGLLVAVPAFVGAFVFAALLGGCSGGGLAVPAQQGSTSGGQDGGDAGDAGGNLFTFSPVPADVADTTPQQRSALAQAGLVAARAARLQHQFFAAGRRLAQSSIVAPASAGSRGILLRKATSTGTAPAQDADSGLYYTTSVAADSSGSANLFYDQAMAHAAGSLSWSAPASNASGQGVTISFTASHLLSASGTMSLEVDDATATTGKATIDLIDDSSLGQAPETLHADLNFTPDPSNPQAGGLDVTGSYAISDPQRTINIGVTGTPVDLEATTFFKTDTAGDFSRSVVGNSGVVDETCYHPVSNYGGSGSAGTAQAAFIVVAANGQTNVTFADESVVSPGNIDTSNPENWTITDTPASTTTTSGGA